jgi:hypothetical protein
MNSPLPLSTDSLRFPPREIDLPTENAGIAAGIAIPIGAGPPAWRGPLVPAGDSALARRWAAVGIAGLILFCIAVQTIGPMGTLTRHISLNNNEGWNAYWSTRALAGQPIYTGAASPLTNNYPPLSFYIVGWLGRAIGDLVLAGRLLSLAGLGASAALVGLIGARLGKDARWAWASAATFLLIAVTMAPRFVASDDPQWSAEAIQLGGLWVLISARTTKPTYGRLVGASLLLLVAGLIKHNQIALPLAITVALAIHDRRGLAVWLAAGVASVAAALGTLHWIYGPAFIDEVMFHQRVLNLRYIWGALISLSFLVPAVGIAIFYLPRLRGWKRDFRLTALICFAGLAIVLGIFERFGAGVSQNAQFDALIAVMILFGVVLCGVPRAYLSSTMRLALLTLAVAPAAAKDLANAPHRIRDWRELNRTDEAWREAIGFLASRPGPIACERPALCYWTGKPYALDFFNYGQKLRLSGDAWDLRDRIAKREFSAIVIIRDERYDQGDARLPTSFYALINANYRVERVLPDNLYVMVPAG